MDDREEGSAVVESVFAIVLTLLLVLGTIQVALFLYARNVVMAAVHDGARAAVEIGTAGRDGVVVARSVIERSAGPLVDDLQVRVTSHAVGDRVLVRVTASGALDAPGPVPISVPVEMTATSSRESFDA